MDFNPINVALFIMAVYPLVLTWLICRAIGKAADHIALGGRARTPKPAPRPESKHPSGPRHARDG